MRTKGKVLAEYAVTVTHNDRHVLVSWDGAVQYRALQDGWTSEAGAIREAARFLLDTDGCYVEVVQDYAPARCPREKGGCLVSHSAPVQGHYSMRLRVKDQD